MLTLQNLLQGIDLAKLQQNEKAFDMGILSVSGSVPANQSLPFQISVSGRGIFLCLFLTGRFSTLTGAATDSGVCALKTSWLNGSSRVYIDVQNPVYLDCLFTPGRVRTAGVTGDPSNQLMFPGMPWVTFFQPKDDLTFNITNEAAYANTFQINLNGIWLKQKPAVK